MGHKDLIEKAVAAYRKDIEPTEGIERARIAATTLALAALPPDVGEYLRVEARNGGGWKYLLKVPDCAPVEIEFVRSSEGFRLLRAFVLDGLGRRLYFRNDVYAAIGRAHLYQNEGAQDGFVRNDQQQHGGADPQPDQDRSGG